MFNDLLLVPRSLPCSHFSCSHLYPGYGELPVVNPVPGTVLFLGGILGKENSKLQITVYIWYPGYGELLVISPCIWRCGGSLVALQTTEAVVPGSNPASLTAENSEDRQSHCVYCRISGQRGRPPPEAK